MAWPLWATPSSVSLNRERRYKVHTGSRRQRRTVSGISNPLLLLRRRDRVLRRLRHAELHHGLCLDLDRLARLRIAAHARLALCLHQSAQSRDHEYAVFLGILYFR